MTLELDTKGKQVDTMGESSFNDDWPEIGHYQFLVNGLEMNPEKVKSCIVIELELITGEVPGQEGKTPTMMLWYDTEHKKWNNSAMERITRWFWAVGLIEEDSKADIEPTDAIGRTFIGKVVKQMRKKKDSDEKEERVGIEDGKYWRCGHPDVKDLFKIDATLAKKADEAPKTAEKADTDEDDLSDL